VAPLHLLLVLKELSLHGCKIGENEECIDKLVSELENDHLKGLRKLVLSKACIDNTAIKRICDGVPRLLQLKTKIAYTLIFFVFSACL